MSSPTGTVLVDDVVRARIRWRCRRGMREMDLILERFLSEGYPHLGPREREAFEAFLEEPDQVLYGWLAGDAAPAQADFRRLVAVIRAAALGRR